MQFTTLATTRRKEQTLKLIQQTYDWFTEGFDSYDLQAAASLRSELDDWLKDGLDFWVWKKLLVLVFM